MEQCYLDFSVPFSLCSKAFVVMNCCNLVALVTNHHESLRFSSFQNNSNSKDAGDCPGQGTGVSAAFLSEIQPQADGCNGVKYNLTPDIIEAIFRIYPAGKQVHSL